MSLLIWLLFYAAGIVVLIFLALVIILQLHALRRGMREQELRASLPPGGDPDHSAPPSLEVRKQGLEDQKMLFKVFVQQFPEIPDLPKKEQFDRFRAWREERGL